MRTVLTSPTKATSVPSRPVPGNNKRRSKLNLGLPGIIWVLAVCAIPTAVMLGTSFFTYEGASVTGPVTLENYTDLFSDSYFRSVLLDTVWMAAAVGVICLILGTLVAHFLVRSNSRLRGLVILLVILPLVSSVVVRTYGWLVLLENGGLINSVAMDLGLIDAPIAFIGSRFAVIIGLVHVLLPFSVFTIMSSLQGVDSSLERASRDLGAGPVTTFRRITIPLIAPGLISGFILTFTISIGAYATVAVLGGGSLQTLAVLVRERMVTSLEWGQAAAIAAIILVIGAFVVGLLLSFSRKTRIPGVSE